jgi:hypothetical protein
MRRGQNRTKPTLVGSMRDYQSPLNTCRRIVLMVILWGQDVVGSDSYFVSTGVTAIYSRPRCLHSWFDELIKSSILTRVDENLVFVQSHRGGSVSGEGDLYITYLQTRLYCPMCFVILLNFDLSLSLVFFLPSRRRQMGSPTFREHWDGRNATRVFRQALFRLNLALRPQDSSDEQTPIRRIILFSLRPRLVSEWASKKCRFPDVCQDHQARCTLHLKASARFPLRPSRPS